jgi:hypothetical protein
LVVDNGRPVVTHWLQDVGSTFGMNNDLHEWDLSWEHLYQGNSYHPHWRVQRRVGRGGARGHHAQAS